MNFITDLQNVSFYFPPINSVSGKPENFTRSRHIATTKLLLLLLVQATHFFWLNIRHCAEYCESCGNFNFTYYLVGPKVPTSPIITVTSLLVIPQLCYSPIKELCLCWPLSLELSSTVLVPGITIPLTSPAADTF